MKNHSFDILHVFSLAAAVLLFLPTSRAADLERPKVELVDKLNVNVATGQVTHSLDTVGIGGAMGLAHGISVHANELNFRRNFGFNDRFWAETRYVHLTSALSNPIPNVFRLVDSSSAADFRVLVNGNPVPYFLDTPPPYVYVAVGDERHTLVSNDRELVWTKPDGTIVKFTRAANATAGATGLMKEIVYPNGFTVSIAVFGLQSVNTNTGFQLKYLYVPDNRPMEKPDNPNLVNAPPRLTSFQSGWSSRNPRYVKAINNAIEHCPAAASTCTLTNNWPTATFDWPAGMPRAFYIGDSEASITSAAGAVAKFSFRAYDLCCNQGVVVPAFPLGTQFSPRLIAVTPFGSSRPHFTYDFTNLLVQLGSSFAGAWSVRAQTAGVIAQATNIDRGVGYSMQQQSFAPGTYLNYGIGGGINRVLMSPSSAPGNPDVISYAETDEGTLRFESNARNFPYRSEKLSGPWEEYVYSRGNLSQVKVHVEGEWRVHREAGYALSCTAATRKTCNQPLWTRDPNGNVTYYTYHPASGQPAMITYPPNKSGIVAQTRFEYAQLSARFFNGGAAKVAGTPIWMKIAEKSCINSNYTGVACAAGDEVVTRFEYHHDNLLLTGVAVTDPLSGETRRTCYQYDIYGNRIGASQPKANLNGCN